MKNLSSKLLSILVSIITAVFILSFSIATPILVRPFYYVQIDMRGLEEKTGFTHEQIRDAYDEMLDYCLGISSEFGTGALRWSEDGKAHFTDVRSLFILDLVVLVVSFILLAAFILCSRTHCINNYKLKGRTPYFYGGAGLLSAFLIIGAVCMIDFNQAFVVFHKIFFPGKDNWLFYPSKDEIIKILPESFFASCAGLILAVMVVMCGVAIVTGRKRKVTHAINAD